MKFAGGDVYSRRHSQRVRSSFYGKAKRTAFEKSARSALPGTYTRSSLSSKPKSRNSTTLFAF